MKIGIIKFFFHIEKKNYRIIMSVLLSNDNKELMITCAANPVKSRKTEDLQYNDKNTIHLPRQHLPFSNGRIYIKRYGS